MRVSASLRGLESLVLHEGMELKHPDLKATNTRQSPDAVAPVAHGDCAFSRGTLTATLKPLSWNVFALRPA
jgi:alpha-N-arabinofuranosidase